MQRVLVAVGLLILLPMGLAEIADAAPNNGAKGTVIKGTVKSLCEKEQVRVQKCNSKGQFSWVWVTKGCAIY
jgi:hypothetical protein